MNLGITLSNHLKKSMGDKSYTVHLMGELTFTYALVNLLTKHNIPVIASTTKRVVIDKENGSKESIFEFVQFRQY